MCGKFYRRIKVKKGTPLKGKVPNATTKKAIADAMARQNITTVQNVQDLYKELDA